MRKKNRNIRRRISSVDMKADLIILILLSYCVTTRASEFLILMNILVPGGCCSYFTFLFIPVIIFCTYRFPYPIKSGGPPLELNK